MTIVTITQTASKAYPKDTMLLTFNIRNFGMTIDEAQTGFIPKREALEKYLLKIGFKKKMLKTNGMSCRKNYRYDENRNNIPHGYVVDETINIISPINKAQLSKINTDMEEIEGVSFNVRFELMEINKPNDEMIAEAFRKAKEQAKLMSELLDGSEPVCSKVNIHSDSMDTSGLMFETASYFKGAAAAPKSINITPTETIISRTITTEWEIGAK